MDAPKKIWAWPHFDGWITGDWSANTYYDDRTVEYILATDHARIVAEKDARIAKLKALIELNRSQAFAATNPANWQRNNTLQARHDHFADTLDEISSRGEDITILEDTFSAGLELGRAENRTALKGDDNG